AYRAFAATKTARANGRSRTLIGIERRTRGELLSDLVVLEDRAAVGAGQLNGATDDSVQDGVEVEGGADGTSDIAEGCELLDGAGKLVRSRLQLGEQAHVLDGDDRLVGEGLEEGDLVIGEAAGLAAGHGQRTDRLVMSEQRHHHQAPVPTDASGDAPVFRPARIGGGVGDVERRSRSYGVRMRVAPCERLREACSDRGVSGVVGARDRDELEVI